MDICMISALMEALIVTKVVLPTILSLVFTSIALIQWESPLNLSMQPPVGHLQARYVAHQGCKNL